MSFAGTRGQLILSRIFYTGQASASVNAELQLPEN